MNSNIKLSAFCPDQECNGENCNYANHNELQIKKKAGRPSEYKEEYIDKASEYLDLCQDEEVEEVIGMSAKGTELYRNKLKVNIPTIEGFASFISVNKTSLYEWEKKHPLFSNALSEIRAEQHKRLINNGLSGDYNPTIAKLILSANHGMKEKTETDITLSEKIGGFNFIRNDGNNSTNN